jgi:hypothetical protein
MVLFFNISVCSRISAIHRCYADIAELFHGPDVIGAIAKFTQSSICIEPQYRRRIVQARRWQG